MISSPVATDCETEKASVTGRLRIAKIRTRFAVVGRRLVLRRIVSISSMSSGTWMYEMLFASNSAISFSTPAFQLFPRIVRFGALMENAPTL
jgi:hypothetical protein